MIETKFRRSISTILKNDHIFFYRKGRVALYALLKAMKVGSGDEVILPGFTCVVVPNAVKYLGAKPVYVDVDRITMNPSLKHFVKAITPRTKVIISQNTFGLSTQVDEIATLAKEKGLFSIEDCTHGFGGTFKGKPNGSYCDAAFYSTQWNKPFSTGIGGFASVNNRELIPELEQINKSLAKPGLKNNILLSALLFAKDHLLNSSNYWRLRSVYRWLSKYNLVTGSSEGKELISVEMPENYFQAMDKVQFKKGIKNISFIGHLLQKRKENAVIYTEFLAKNNKYHVDKVLHPNHSFLKYPVLVNNRMAFENKAIKAKIELGDWFCTPLYPVAKNLELWDLKVNDVPQAQYMSKHIVNLPADTDNPNKVIEFLKDNLDEII